MKYNIISINDDRKDYKYKIRTQIKAIDEVKIPATNALEVDLNEELEKRQLKVNPIWHPSKGELGVWLSTFDCWAWSVMYYQGLIVFEDDAIIAPNFEQQFYTFERELPEDADYLSLWVPENQHIDYIYDVVYDEDGRWEKVGPDRNVITSIHNFGAIRLARVYQGYGNVATYYDPRGAYKLMRHAQIYGIHGPIDCWIHDRAHTGIVNGFAPKPQWANAVTYDWRAETTVHNTERI